MSDTRDPLEKAVDRSARWKEFFDLEERMTRTEAENERLRADLVEIERIANIAPADDSFGSLAVRMGKVWLLARGNQQSVDATKEV